MNKYTTTLFPSEAKTTLNSKSGWLDKSNNFWPEDVVLKAVSEFNKKKELCYFTIKHNEDKVNYYTFSWKTLWFLFRKCLLGWTILLC